MIDDSGAGAFCGLDFRSETTRSPVRGCHERTPEFGSCRSNRDRSRETGNGSRASTVQARHPGPAGQVALSPAIRQFGPVRRQQRVRTQRPGRHVCARTKLLRSRVRRRLRVLAETDGSSIGQPPKDAVPKIRPGLTYRSSQHHPPGTSLDFTGPSRFNCGVIRGWRFIETRK